MKDYRKTTLIWFILCIIIGIGCVISGVYFENEFLVGFGSAMGIVILLRLVKLLWQTRNDDSKYEYNMSMSDERTVYLAHKARSFSFVVTIFGEIVLLLTLFFLEEPVAVYLAYLLCAQALLYTGSYYYFRSKN